MLPTARCCANRLDSLFRGMRSPRDCLQPPETRLAGKQLSAYIWLCVWPSVDYIPGLVGSVHAV